jgi:hypothetical protein
LQTISSAAIDKVVTMLPVCGESFTNKDFRAVAEWSGNGFAAYALRSANLR